jgi:hypothetical protein
VRKLPILEAKYVISRIQTFQRAPNAIDSA